MKDRLIAAGIHLGISLLVAGLVLFLLFAIWFPSPLIELGALQGVQLILLVDLAIGPFLTLIVFKKGKKTLILDMSVIAVLQILALSYGLSVIYTQTPSYLVLTYDGLYLVNRYEVDNYISEKQLFVPEPVASNPVKYEGQVPVYQLIESSNAQERLAANSDFLNNQSLPVYMNSSIYTAFQGFDYLINAGRGSVEEYEQGKSCLNIPIISVHGSILTCLYENEGVLRLSHKSDLISE